jgi:hypothetical protein
MWFGEARQDLNISDACKINNNLKMPLLVSDFFPDSMDYYAPMPRRFRKCLSHDSFPRLTHAFFRDWLDAVTDLHSLKIAIFATVDDGGQ